MSTSNSWCPGRCQACGAGATTQINGAEWYCAIHVPNRPLSYPLAGRPGDLAELAALRARLAEVEKENAELSNWKSVALERGYPWTVAATDRIRELEAAAKELAAVAKRADAFLNWCFCHEEHADECACVEAFVPCDCGASRVRDALKIALAALSPDARRMLTEETR